MTRRPNPATILRALVELQNAAEKIIERHFLRAGKYSGGATLLLAAHYAASECAVLCAHLRDRGASAEEMARVRADFREAFDLAFATYDLGMAEAQAKEKR